MKAQAKLDDDPEDTFTDTKQNYDDDDISMAKDSSIDGMDSQS